MSHPTLSRRWRPGMLFAPLALALQLGVPAEATAQLGAGVARTTRLEPTSNSTVAVTEFNSALMDIASVQPARARAHLRRALDADPTLGIARVYNATLTEGLTTAQRDEEFTRGIADAAKASTAEFMIAAAARARYKGDFVQARSLFESAAAMLPGDPHIAHQLALVTAQVPGANYADAIAPLTAITVRFPEYAPARNELAYRLWRTGSKGAAMESVRRYVALAPADPNPHDSYAELLQWSGRFSEAIVEYEKALAADATYFTAGLGVAEVRVLEGKGELARTAITNVIPRITFPATKVAYLRQIASTHVLEGNARMATTQLQTALTEATTQNLPSAMDGLHIDMAIVDALLGDGRAVEGHLGAVGTTVTALNKEYFTGIAFALSNQNVKARAALEGIRRNAPAQTTPMSLRYEATVNALILINEGKANEAITEIGRTDLVNPLTRAVLATAHAKAGNMGLARSLRDEILGDRMLNLANGDQLTARVLVKRIN